MSIMIGGKPKTASTPKKGVSSKGDTSNAIKSGEEAKKVKKTKKEE